MNPCLTIGRNVCLIGREWKSSDLGREVRYVMLLMSEGLVVAGGERGKTAIAREEETINDSSADTKVSHGRRRKHKREVTKDSRVEINNLERKEK